MKAPVFIAPAMDLDMYKHVVSNSVSHLSHGGGCARSDEHGVGQMCIRDRSMNDACTTVSLPTEMLINNISRSLFATANDELQIGRAHV